MKSNIYLRKNKVLKAKDEMKKDKMKKENII